MQLEHTFTVPADVEQAWQVLLDIERVAPCMPGASLDSVDGDDFTGTVKVRLGPIGLTYKGKASFVEKDATAHRAVIHAQGKDARGNGTASATVTATLTQQGSDTLAVVSTDLNITGKPAQFGRGVMVEVGNKLIGQFADCLAGKLTSPPAPAAPDQAPSPDQATSAGLEPEQGARPVKTPPQAVPAHTAPDRAAPAPAENQPIDLLGSAGPAIAKRLVPVVVVAVLLYLLLRRRRCR